MESGKWGVGSGNFQEVSFAHFPAQLELASQSVQIWCAQLDLGPAQLHQLAQTLSPDEQARANRFRFERDRQRFIAGRGILRFLLAHYLNASPAQLQFTYSAHGKPALAHPELFSKISFNVSHSNGLVLYAVACDRTPGIDLEEIRAIPDLEQLAQRFFLPSENALIQAALPEQQQTLFFRLWTCKEAYLKATGEGITGLKRVEVIPVWDDTVLLKLNGTPAVGWTVLPLHCAPDYAAALAVEGSNLEVAYYSLV